ncbi:MAG: ATP-binding protein [Bdellovibrionota bacterium]
MHKLDRYVKNGVIQDLKDKMVFVGGPRQVGKTTLALSLLKNGSPGNPAYLNWDNISAKKIIKSGEFPKDEKLIIFDEIHKYKNWRNLIKGFFDTQRDKHQFLVTGSAMLDYYRKGGDSLLGRYFYHRLHPLSVSELGISTNHDIKQLINLSGFPEPFFKGQETFKKRWQNERHQKILFEDIRDLENVREVTLMEDLFDNLPLYSGSLLNYNSLANLLEVNIRTIQNWTDIFDRIYLTYKIKPYISGKLRLVKKSTKLYFWDWSTQLTEGAKFENLVASHLLKYCHYIEDTQGEKMELRYLKDREGREIDFVVLKNKKAIFAVECKVGERSISPNITYFKERLDIPQFYQVHLGSVSYLKEGVRVLPFHEFCTEVGLC